MIRRPSGAKHPIAEAAKPPSESEIEALLGDGYPAFQTLLGREGASAEWRRYNSRSPWVMKVSEGKRTLFYARPEAGHVRVTVLLAGRAVEAALAGRISKALRASILKAKPYPEGRPVSVVVKKAADVANVERLIAVKLQTTTRSRRRPS